jgi:AcrR family transcriptional regulator
MRADARKNREKLLGEAAILFAESGVNASLEEIARRSGVGVGTLYRHFPTRDALVAATYQHEVDQLCDSVGGLLASGAPDAALRAWMDGFLRYTATKRGMGEALQSIMASDSELSARVRTRLSEALAVLVGAAVAAGSIRPDARPDDVLRALGAIWILPEGPDREEQAGRILDLLMDGLRHGAPR